jgi:hypothetical protein
LVLESRKIETRARGRRAVALRKRSYCSWEEVQRAKEVVFRSMLVTISRARKSWKAHGGLSTS